MVKGNQPYKGYIIVHHSGGTDLDPLFDTSNQSFDDINSYHKLRWNGSTKSSLGFYCGYHYVIEKSGKLTQARLDTDEGAHCIGRNFDSIGICLVGNFDTTEPSEAQKTTLVNLLKLKQTTWDIPTSRIVPHRKFASKTCYGNHIYDKWAQDLLLSNLYPDPLVRRIIQALVLIGSIIDLKVIRVFSGEDKED